MKRKDLIRLDKYRVLIFDPASKKYILHVSPTICGARTKSTGEPCQIKDVYSNGRCKFHGGLSTGPKTKEGKVKSARNGFKKVVSDRRI